MVIEDTRSVGEHRHDEHQPRGSVRLHQTTFFRVLHSLCVIACDICNIANFDRNRICMIPKMLGGKICVCAR